MRWSRRLLEHQKVKAAAGLLHEREQLRAAQWLRPDGRVAELAGDDYEPELEVDLFKPDERVPGPWSTASSCGRRCCCRPKRSRSSLRIEQLLARLSETESARLRGSLFGHRGSPRHDRDLPGLLLEMIRLKLVRVFQSGSFGPIRVYKTRQARGRAASNWRPGGQSWADEKDGREGQDGRDGLDGLEGQDRQDRREADAEIQEGESLPKRGAARAEVDSRGVDLCLARSDDGESDVPACSTPSQRKTSIAAIARAERGLRAAAWRPAVVEVAGGYQIVTRSDLHEWVRRLFHERTTRS